MVKYSLYVQLEAKPGKGPDVENFLADALPMVQRESGTVTWYALKMGPTTFAIFDTFEDGSGRDAHLEGEVAAALKERADELFAKPLDIHKIDVIGAKVPD